MVPTRDAGVLEGRSEGSDFSEAATSSSAQHNAQLVHVATPTAMIDGCAPGATATHRSRETQQIPEVVPSAGSRAWRGSPDSDTIAAPSTAADVSSL